MRTRIRPAVVLGLLCLTQVPELRAQTFGFESFKWYIGAHAGVTLFETPAQTRGGIFTAGGNFLITAKRTGLLIQVEEGIKKNQQSFYSDPAVPGTNQRVVAFNDIRKYTFSLVAFPFRTAAQPYIGIGYGILQTVNEYPSGPFASAAERDQAKVTAERLGSHGFGSFVGGLQFRADRFMLFGQYQITTSPSAGRLFTGPTHAFTGGMRISLGNSREGANGSEGN